MSDIGIISREIRVYSCEIPMSFFWKKKKKKGSLFDQIPVIWREKLRGEGAPFLPHF